MPVVGLPSGGAGPHELRRLTSPAGAEPRSMPARQRSIRSHRARKSTCLRRHSLESSLLRGVRTSLPLVGLFHVFRRFVLGSLRVIAGALGELVLVDGAFTLARDVEDLAQVDVRPHFGPLGLEIAVE